ncbi:HNH endonuclease [Niveispirillum cyanobacteriorum]
MPQRPDTFRPPGWKPAPAKQPQAHDPFYGSAIWKALRSKAKQRDGFQCVGLPDRPCRTPNNGRGGRLIVDHIDPRREGGSDELSNLRTLCPACDNRRHGRRG